MCICSLSGQRRTIGCENVDDNNGFTRLAHNCNGHIDLQHAPWISLKAWPLFERLLQIPHAVGHYLVRVSQILLRYHKDYGLLAPAFLPCCLFPQMWWKCRCLFMCTELYFYEIWINSDMKSGSIQIWNLDQFRCEIFIYSDVKSGSIQIWNYLSIWHSSRIPQINAIFSNHAFTQASWLLFKCTNKYMWTSSPHGWTVISLFDS